MLPQHLITARRPGGKTRHSRCSRPPPDVSSALGRRSRLLDELLCLEVAPQVEHLPGGEAEEAAHTEHTEVQNPRAGRLWGREGGHKSAVSTYRTH